MGQFTTLNMWNYDDVNGMRLGKAKAVASMKPLPSKNKQPFQALKKKKSLKSYNLLKYK